jgi:hypothetical protein
MTNRHWRELLEIVGIVAIVASLLLLTTEIRQSNRIAAAQTPLQIAAAFDELHLARAVNPDFAKLFPKLEAPEAHLTTATEISQIRGIAWHYFTVLWSVQNAYENGLLNRETLDRYIAEFAYILERWPGIRSHFVDIYGLTGSAHEAEVFTPIADYLTPQAAVDE